MNSVKKILFVSVLFAIFFVGNVYGQKPYRAGTVTANFLEIGYGNAGNSMGDAFTSIANDASSIYWNPAGLATIGRNEVQFSYQPWLADINTSFTAVSINIESVGAVGFGVIAVDYGDMDVTTLDFQTGTGETFSASDFAFSVAFSRKLAQWFSFGASAKYISSTIWHTTATAIAFDMGVLINTGFFSPTDQKEHGLNIGMSVSNYGTPMKYDGQDLLQSIDTTPNEEGDYDDVQGKYNLNEWELPLMFRLGVSMNVVKSDNHTFIVAFDALHPNNNSESVNIGGQYSYLFPGVLKFSVSGGYKALFMNESEYGLSLGASIESYMLYNNGYRVSYAYREHKVLGGTHSYDFNIFF